MYANSVDRVNSIFINIRMTRVKLKVSYFDNWNPTIRVPIKWKIGWNR